MTSPDVFVDVATLIQPTTTSSIPHLQTPFTLTGDGSLAVLEQDTDAEVQQCVRVLLGTQVGQRIDQPDYGVTDPTFSQNGSAVLEASRAIDTWEPRATGTRLTPRVNQDGTTAVLVEVPAQDNR